MILTADYHTHTSYSHGKGTVLENAVAAKKKNLKEIAVTDHGFAHPAFGMTKRKIPSLKEDCKAAAAETGVKVLTGLESNVISIDGGVDLKTRFYDDFDIFLAGVHIFVEYRIDTLFNVFFPNFFTDKLKTNSPKWLIKNNTKMMINVIKNNPVDVITHLNYGYRCDVKEVAKAAADYGTYIEINAKKKHLSDEDIAAAASAGAKFVLSSDAHSPYRVGEVSLAEEAVTRSGLDKKLIANIDGRLPKFRFGEYKNRA